MYDKYGHKLIKPFHARIKDFFEDLAWKFWKWINDKPKGGEKNADQAHLR